MLLIYAVAFMLTGPLTAILIAILPKLNKDGWMEAPATVLMEFALLPLTISAYLVDGVSSAAKKVNCHE